MLSNVEYPLSRGERMKPVNKCKVEELLKYCVATKCCRNCPFVEKRICPIEYLVECLQELDIKELDI